MTSPDDLANWELAVWALGLLDGAMAFVDVEDISLRAFELAPTRLAWRSRPDLPDYNKCSKALRDADRRRPPLLLKTADGLRRQLTVEGQQWVEQNQARMSSLLHHGKTIQEPRSRPHLRMIAEVERSEPFRQWLSDHEVPNEKWRAAELLRCSPDSDRRIWKERLQVLRAAANRARRNELLSFLDELGEHHPEWFEEEVQ